MARTDIDRLLRFVQAQDDGRATYEAIKGKFSWSDEKLGRLVTESDGRLRPVRWGRSRGLAQTGLERGRRGTVHLYSDVCRVLASTWAKKCGWQAAVALDTSLNGRARTGSWSRPDCVLVWYPARRTRLDDLPTVSTYEIEAPKRFDIQSVYEAHAQGYGADFSWVVFHRPAAPLPNGPHVDWNRIRWAASATGVGLISYTNPGNAATWQIEADAPRRHDADRAEFLKRAVPVKMRGTADMSLHDLRSQSLDVRRP
jgi:hypothetical protein